MSKVNEDTTIIYRIRPIDGTNDNRPFDFETTFSEIHYNGLGAAIVNNTDYWQCIGHDSEHFEILSINIK